MRVILATDGSDHANEAAVLLSHLPHAEKLELIVLLVSNVETLHSTLHEDAIIGQIHAEDRRRAQIVFDKYKSHFAGKNAELELAFEVGNVGATIVDLAESRDADLVVLGAVGHSALERLLGSVSDFVALHARCSVLVVRPTGVSTKTTPVKICFAVDGSDQSNASIDQFAKTGWGAAAKLDVVNIVNIPILFPDNPYEFNMTEINKAMDRIVEKAAVSLKPVSPNIEKHLIDWNHVGDGIVRFSKDHACDLIVMGETGSGLAGWLERFFLGSVSKYVLRHSQCSVWISRKK